MYDCKGPTTTGVAQKPDNHDWLWWVAPLLLPVPRAMWATSMPARCRTLWCAVVEIPHWFRQVKPYQASAPKSFDRPCWLCWQVIVCVYFAWYGTPVCLLHNLSLTLNFSRFALILIESCRVETIPSLFMLSEHYPSVSSLVQHWNKPFGWLNVCKTHSLLLFNASLQLPRLSHLPLLIPWVTMPLHGITIALPRQLSLNLSHGKRCGEGVVLSGKTPLPLFIVYVVDPADCTLDMCVSQMCLCKHVVYTYDGINWVHFAAWPDVFDKTVWLQALLLRMSKALTIYPVAAPIATRGPNKRGWITLTWSHGPNWPPRKLACWQSLNRWMVASTVVVTVSWIQHVCNFVLKQTCKLLQQAYNLLINIVILYYMIYSWITTCLLAGLVHAEYVVFCHLWKHVQLYKYVGCLHICCTMHERLLSV